MARQKIHRMVPAAALESIFGITRKHLRDLGLKPEVIDGEHCFPLDDAVTRCTPTITKKMAALCDWASALDADEVKTQKAIEAARKLQLANDALENSLIDRERYAADYAAKLEAVRAIIAEIPDMLGDIDPAALAIVHDAVADAVGG